MKKFHVICINDKNKPASISQKNWPKEEAEIYTVVKVQTMANQANITGFVLEEIQPDANSGFDSYKATRFAPATEADIAALNAVKELVEESLEDLILN
jgi:hypothetical protein